MDNLDVNAYETCYSLNFHEHFKEVVDFSVASWNLSHIFLTVFSGVELTDRQRVCVLMVGKGRRLLRSIYKLTSDGYWPEAEIIFRALFEVQFLLIYILEDETGQRATEWLTRSKPTERWPVSELLNDFVDLKKIYSNISLYPHSHVLSTAGYSKHSADNEFSMESSSLGGDENNNKAKNILGTAAMTNSSLMELAFTDSPDNESWEKAHLELRGMTYYKEESHVHKPTDKQLEILAKKIMPKATPL